MRLRLQPHPPSDKKEKLDGIPTIFFRTNDKYPFLPG